MSQTVDVNVLLYASNAEAPEHERALALVEHLAAGPELLVLFWPVAMSYLRIATHPSIFARPLKPNEAMSNVEQLMTRPHVRMAGTGDRFWRNYRELAQEVRPSGNAVPDAQLVALMIEHGVRDIWSRDRDFRRYDRITVRDPFDDRYSSGFGHGG
jgi:toxin-antitoxin system PIN domain toxin